MRITRVFFDTHMGLGFEGLGQIAKKAKTPNNEDTTILFINRKMTSFKLIRAKQFIVYFKYNKRIPLDAIEKLPTFFGGDPAEMDRTIRESLSSRLRV